MNHHWLVPFMNMNHHWLVPFMNPTYIYSVKIIQRWKLSFIKGGNYFKERKLYPLLLNFKIFSLKSFHT